MDDKAEFERLRTMATEKIEFAITDAVSRGKSDYVVVVLDIRDNAARRIANTIAGEEATANMLTEGVRRESTPILSVAQPRETILSFLDQIGAELPTASRTPATDGMFRVFAVAGGGVANWLLPLPT
jgi:hypothetical protein